MLIDELAVPKNILELHKDNTIFMNENEFFDYIYDLEDKNLETTNGSSATIYFDNDEAIKVFKREPLLFDKNNSYVYANGYDVVNNVFNLIGNNNENASIPKKLYVVDGKLAMYKSKKINIPRFDSIKRENDIYVDDIKSAWNKAYELGDYFASKQIVMYDLNSHNSFIKNGDFKVCDLDFYSCEPFGDISKEKNNKLINALFTNFIEWYLFFDNIEIKKDEYLFATNNYVDYVFDELECITGVVSAKTLKDVVK